MLRFLTLIARYRLLGIAILISLTASACVGTRLGDSWAGVSTLGDERNILLSYNDSIVMVNPSNGRPIELHDEAGNVMVDSEGKVRTWQLVGDGESASRFFSSPILADENTLLAASYDGKIYKVDPQTANIKRSAQVFNGQANAGSGCIGDCVLADPVLEGESLYLALSNKDLVEVNTADLTVRWRFATEHGVWSKPILDDGVLYFASLDHYLYAVDAESGEEIWKTDVQGALPSSPTIYEGKLYIGGLARKIVEISLDGEILNEYETEDWVWNSPVVVDDILYTADLSGHVYALDTNEGLKEIWKVKAATMGIRPTPLVSGDSIIVASRDGRVYWLDRSTGAQRFEPIEVGAEILSDILLIEPNETLTIEPMIVVSTVAQDKLLVALTLEGGQQRWIYPR